MGKTGKALTATKFRTPRFRLSFPHLFEKFAFEDSQKPAYLCTAIFDDNCDFSVFDNAADAAIEKMWGTKPPRKLTVYGPVNEEDLEGEPRPEYENKVIGKFKSQNRKPKIFDKDRVEIIDEEEIYAGCYCVAVVEAYAWAHPAGGNGVSYSLLGIQKVADGEPLGNTCNEDDFEVSEDVDEKRTSRRHRERE